MSNPNRGTVQSGGYTNSVKRAEAMSVQRIMPTKTDTPRDPRSWELDRAATEFLRLKRSPRRKGSPGFPDDTAERRRVRQSGRARLEPGHTLERPRGRAATGARLHGTRLPIPGSN